METLEINRRNYQIGGIILLILGIIGMLAPEFATGVFMAFLAAMLIIGGIVFFIAGFKGGWANYLVGIVLLIFGILMFIYSSQFTSALTFIIGAWLLLMGVVTSIVAFAARSQYSGWWAPMLTGIISFILGILIFVGWPGNSDWLIGLFIGIELFFDGIMMLVLSAYGS